MEHQAAIAIGNALSYQEERRARDEMETERRRLAALVESSPVGVMVVDAATRTFASVNQEAERILGMSPEPGTSLVRYHEVAIYRRMDGKRYEGHERPLAGGLSVTPKPTDVKTLVDEAKTAFLRRGSRNTVEVDLPSDLPRVGYRMVKP